MIGIRVQHVFAPNTYTGKGVLLHEATLAPGVTIRFHYAHPLIFCSWSTKGIQRGLFPAYEAAAGKMREALAKEWSLEEGRIATVYTDTTDEETEELRKQSDTRVTH